MNDSGNERQKAAVIKTLAIIGFIVALIFLAWLAVQAVRLGPSAFRTLGSIAESLRRGRQEDAGFAITPSAETVNTGEMLTILWTPDEREGQYVFSYQCAEGVMTEIKDADGNLSRIECGIDTPLSADSTGLEIVFSSERERTVSIPYTLAFIIEEEERIERTGTVTVVNQSISEEGLAEAPAAEEPPVNETPLEDIPNTGLYDDEPEPVRYRTVPVVTTAMPVSNPNGSADLAITFIGVGSYNTETKRFTTKTSLEEGARAALQFAVKNIGTKTSDEWYFSASLPTDPEYTYTSTANTGLRPNERQVITLQFDNVSEDGENRVTASVTGGDINTANNSFSRTISVSE